MRKIVCLCVVLAVVISLTGCFGTEEPLAGLAWLRELNAEDVASIRFTLGENPISYTDYAPEEFGALVELLKSCDGVADEENNRRSTQGGWKYFYVTMADGTVHSLINWGTYVTIDGEAFADCGEWLAQWPEDGRVQVDQVQRVLNALERERTKEVLYLCRYGEELPDQTWVRAGEDWYKTTDDDGKCSSWLFYEGRQFLRTSQYVGPQYYTEDSGWEETDAGEIFDLPWPMDQRQDPADYEFVEAEYDVYGVATVTLRYRPDGTVLQFYTDLGDWVSGFYAAKPDGTEIRYSLLDPSSTGSDFVLQSYGMVATGQYQEEPDPYELDPEASAMWEERCRLALEELQTADSYSLLQTENDAILRIWNSGDDWLRQYEYVSIQESYVCYEGRCFEKNAATVLGEHPWKETAETEITRNIRSWLEDYQWDGENIYCDRLYENDGESRVSLFCLDEGMTDGYYSLTFVLDEDGRLVEVYKNWLESDPGSASNHSTVQVFFSEGVAEYIADAYRETAGE